MCTVATFSQPFYYVADDAPKHCIAGTVQYQPLIDDTYAMGHFFGSYLR